MLENDVLLKADIDSVAGRSRKRELANSIGSVMPANETGYTNSA